MNMMQPAIVLGILGIFICASQAAAEAPRAYRVGEVRVDPLLDVDRGMPVSIFSGASPEVTAALAPSGEAPSGIYAFVVRRGDRVILIDTGFGKADNPQSLLGRSLGQAGLRPEDVTHVLLTHLHGDHVGGLAKDGKAAFPNALVFVSEPEKNFWFDDAALAEQPDKLPGAGLARRNLGLYGDRVRTFRFGQEVVPGITAADAVGHTPGHTAFLLESRGEKMLFWGDTVHAAALQFPHPEICASFDMDKEQATTSRRRLMRMAAEENIPVAGAHFPAPAVGRVERAGDTFALKGF